MKMHVYITWNASNSGYGYDEVKKAKMFICKNSVGLEFTYKKMTTLAHFFIGYFHVVGYIYIYTC